MFELHLHLHGVSLTDFKAALTFGARGQCPCTVLAGH